MKSKSNSRPLLTIITPCHNSATFVFRLLNSVLRQTYPNVEMIMIDNASSDGTKEIIQSYIPQFQRRGYKLFYHYQEDMGPSHGLQTGMKFMHGEYLTFPDSDDYYACDEALEIMIDKLESLSSEYAIVRSQVQRVDENTMSPCGTFGAQIIEGDSKNMFEDCLFNTNGYYYVNIGYLIRTAALKEVLGLNFYTAYNVGPGRQVYCPLYFYRRCYSISKVLSNYLVREKSLSHADYSKYQVRKELYKQSSVYFDALMRPIRDIFQHKRNLYKKMFMYQETCNIANIAWSHNKKDYLIYKFYMIKYSSCPHKELLRFIKSLCQVIVRNLLRYDKNNK